MYEERADILIGALEKDLRKVSRHVLCLLFPCQERGVFAFSCDMAILLQNHNLANLTIILPFSALLANLTLFFPTLAKLSQRYRVLR